MPAEIAQREDAGNRGAQGAGGDGQPVAGGEVFDEGRNGGEDRFVFADEVEKEFALAREEGVDAVLEGGTTAPEQFHEDGAIGGADEAVPVVGEFGGELEFAEEPAESELVERFGVRDHAVEVEDDGQGAVTEVGHRSQPRGGRPGGTARGEFGESRSGPATGAPPKRRREGGPIRGVLDAVETRGERAAGTSPSPRRGSARGFVHRPAGQARTIDKVDWGRRPPGRGAIEAGETRGETGDSAVAGPTARFHTRLCQ